MAARPSGLGGGDEREGEKLGSSMMRALAAEEAGTNVQRMGTGLACAAKVVKKKADRRLQVMEGTQLEPTRHTEEPQAIIRGLASNCDARLIIRHIRLDRQKELWDRGR
jgi:hypothetical protein